MTPAILINIDVDDLDRAVAFYASLLELKVGRSFGASGIELMGGSADLTPSNGTAVKSWKNFAPGDCPSRSSTLIGRTSASQR